MLFNRFFSFTKWVTELNERKQRKQNSKNININVGCINHSGIFLSLSLSFSFLCPLWQRDSRWIKRHQTMIVVTNYNETLQMTSSDIIKTSHNRLLSSRTHTRHNLAYITKNFHSEICWELSKVSWTLFLSSWSASTSLLLSFGMLWFLSEE